MMKHYFSLKGYPDKLRIEIGKTIEEYYPVGIDQQSAEYFEYPGIKKLELMLAEYSSNNTSFHEVWKLFLIKLPKDLRKKMHSTTYGFVPGFSADLILERYEDEAMVRLKKLTFAVSMIGPFFSICGVDETFIKEKDHPTKAYGSINVITASPYKEFEKDFLYLKEKIEETFEGYQYVPMIAALSFLENMQIYHSYREEYTVYNALFNHLFDYYDHQKLFRGDMLYGLDKSMLPKVTLRPPPAL
jgi:hypothetical protein